MKKLLLALIASAALMSTVDARRRGCGISRCEAEPTCVAPFKCVKEVTGTISCEPEWVKIPVCPPDYTKVDCDVCNY